MRKIAVIVFTAAAGLGLSQASAADLARAPVYTKAPPPVPAWSWTGSYIGGYVGGAWGAKDAVTTDPTTAAGIVYNGVTPTVYDLGSSVIAGYTGGYNYQFAPNWVIGYEGETGYIHLSGSRIANPLGLNDTSAHTKIGDWYSVYSGRFGYAWDRSLIYVKGGLTVARIETGVTDTNVTGLTIDTTAHRWRVGYAVGGGWEYAFDPKWSLKAEYLYLGINQNYTTSGIASNGLLYSNTTNVPGVHTAKIGLNYKWDWFSLLR